MLRFGVYCLQERVFDN